MLNETVWALGNNGQTLDWMVERNFYSGLELLVKWPQETNGTLHNRESLPNVTYGFLSKCDNDACGIPVPLEVNGVGELAYERGLILFGSTFKVYYYAISCSNTDADGGHVGGYKVCKDVYCPEQECENFARRFLFGFDSEEDKDEEKKDETDGDCSAIEEAKTCKKTEGCTYSKKGGCREEPEERFCELAKKPGKHDNVLLKGKKTGSSKAVDVCACAEFCGENVYSFQQKRVERMESVSASTATQ
eukprot:TRINITY_DN4379_c0_g1_i1.p1 TRINITY_DN4379_c0_g1~~TRINITY_DN4379_c0_g1_i1.p1  ORF type:complete len:247 (+),score=28.27 TRINITY_DN4379_c0_g1_i1:148-888(+)